MGVIRGLPAASGPVLDFDGVHDRRQPVRLDPRQPYRALRVGAPLNLYQHNLYDGRNWSKSYAGINYTVVARIYFLA